MSISISSNFAAAAAARNLESANANLVKSLTRLSSGKKIVSPQDDAGGEAVQLKLGASIARYDKAKSNIQNAISILQVQDGVLQTATEVVGRIAELKAMSEDSTKNSQDKQNYNEEYQVLRQQIMDLQTEQFNGVAMFGTVPNQTDASNAGVYQIYTTEQGSATNAPSVILEGVFLATAGHGARSQTYAAVNWSIGTAGGMGGAVLSQSTGGLATTHLSMDGILSDLQSLSNARAKNGALQSRMEFAYNNASVGKVNLEAARGRIVDLDIAEESTNFAKANIMAQAAASILSQANATSRSALNLLMG